MTLRQSRYRFFEDGDKDASTPLAAEDAPVTVLPDTRAGVRVQIDATGDPPARSYKLQYRLSGGDWQDVPVYTPEYFQRMQALSPTLYWHLSDNDSTVRDVSGNGYHGTYAGSISYLQSAPHLLNTYDASVAFDGSTAYISIADAAALRPETTGRFSAVFWLYLNSYNNNVLPRAWEKGAHFGCFMGDSANGMYRRLAIEIAKSGGGTSEYWGHTQLELDRWYHVVMTFDQSTGDGRIYVDGIPEVMTNIFPWSGATMSSTAGSAMYIARRSADLTRNLYGRLDEFAWLPGVVLTPRQVDQLYRAARSSHPGYALRFIGATNSYITTTYTPPAGTAFSLSFWYRSFAHENNDRVIDWQASGPSGGWTVLQSTAAANSVRFVCNNGATETARLDFGGIAPGTWAHLGVTHDGTTARIYRDGTLVATDTSAVFTDPSQTLTFGARSTTPTNNLANIALYDIRFFNRQLSDSEMANEAAGVYTTDGLQAYWRGNTLEGDLIENEVNNGAALSLQSAVGRHLRGE